MPELTLGVDARPALFGRTGFGRVVRESIRALRERDDVRVRAYGAAWRRARPDSPMADVCAPRWPGRLQHLLAPVGFGVESVLGKLDIYHHTDLVFAPVRRTPEVLTIYDLVFLQDQRWHKPGFGRAVMKRLSPRAARARQIVVPCQRVADDVVRHGLAPASRVQVACLGADHMNPAPDPADAARVARVLRRSGLGARRETPLVLLPGTREPRKNQAAVLDAFLRGEGGSAADLLFVGAPGWGCAELEQRLLRLVGSEAGQGMSTRRVGVAGEVTELELEALYKACDLVVYPSLAEGFGLPVAEAMACGRAVLTSRGTPMADFGGDAVEAVDPRDVVALERALNGLLESASWRAELGASAASRIAPCTWESHTQVLVDVYRSALS